MKQSFGAEYIGNYGAYVAPTPVPSLTTDITGISQLTCNLTTTRYGNVESGALVAVLIAV